MDWTKAPSFRREIENLGIVQTDDISAQFLLTDRIGKGTFSEVYRAEHKDTQNMVAVKLVKKPLGQIGKNADAEVWNDFMEEVRVLAMAQGHENILRLQGSRLHMTFKQCKLAMITEHLDISLIKIVKQHGMLPEAAARGVAESLLRAVAHLNSVGLVHRDIKVSNVMVRSLKRGGVVLIHYGFGRVVEGPEVPPSLVGTVGYLAPELFIENSCIDQRYCDVFSVGVVVMACLLGRSVFQGKDEDGVADDRKKFFENRDCQIDWVRPADRLTPEGLTSMKALLEPDPCRRPLAEMAFRAPWFDLPIESCLASGVPTEEARALALLTSPPASRKRLDRSAGEAHFRWLEATEGSGTPRRRAPGRPRGEDPSGRRRSRPSYYSTRRQAAAEPGTEYANMAVAEAA